MNCIHELLYVYHEVSYFFYIEKLKNMENDENIIILAVSNPLAPKKLINTGKLLIFVNPKKPLR